MGQRDSALIARGVDVSALSTSCEGKTKSCALSLKLTGAALTAIDLATGGLLSLPGGSTIEVWATDVSEPVGGSVPPDRYAVRVGGSDYQFSLGDRTDQRQLTRGNVRVPN
jgi:hypothetical protein